MSRTRTALAVACLAAACGPAQPPAPVAAPVEPAPVPPSQPPPTTTPAPVVAPDGVRLPRPFTIEQATVALEIDPARETMKGRVRFDGVMATDATVLWLHAEELTITRATMARVFVAEPAAATFDRKPAPPPVALEVLTGLGRGRVALRAPAPLPAGVRYTLELEYEAPVDGVQTTGTFRQQLDGRWYVYTQHESVFARRSFPCLDEPDLKIPWSVSLTVPADQVALANAPEVSSMPTTDGRKTVRFATTEPLPSYLVAYAVGPFEIVDAGRSSGGAPIRIVTPHGKTDEAWFAVEATPKLVAAAERWFGTPYPFAKLDSIAIPQTIGFGAMEHPGLITYTERLILMPRDAPETRKRSYARVGGHEIAHQWFGNLVTPVFWDDIWLNESFASWLPPKMLEEVYPDYRRPEDDTMQRSGVLTVDGLSTARRIRQPIAAEDDIVNAFDGISYGKGASVLRMMEAWVGEEKFREGVRWYLDAHARGNATAADFVKAIAGHTDVPDVERAFASFLDQAGAPRVEATVDCSGGAPAVELRQRRYAPLGAAAADAGARWRLPVCVRAGAEKVCGVLDGESVRLPLARCPRWVWPNADARGYFRSALPAAGWRALARAPLTVTERLAAAQDLWAGVAAGEVGVDVALDGLPALLAVKSPRAVQVVAGVIDAVQPWVPAASRGRLAAWVDRRLGKRARALGWLRRAGDTVDDEDVRDRLVPLVASFGDRALGREAVKLAADWRALPEAPRRTILRAAVRTDASVHDRLMVDFRGEQQPSRANDLASALGVVRDPGRLDAAMALVLDEAIPVRTALGILGAAVGDDDNRERAEAFVVAHLDAILARLPEDWRAGQVWLLAASCDAAKVAPMRALAEEKLAAWRGARRPIDQAFERMEQCAAQRAAHGPALTRWLAKAR